MHRKTRSTYGPFLFLFFALFYHFLIFLIFLIIQHDQSCRISPRAKFTWVFNYAPSKDTRYVSKLSSSFAEASVVFAFSPDPDRNSSSSSSSGSGSSSRARLRRVHEVLSTRNQPPRRAARCSLSLSLSSTTTMKLCLTKVGKKQTYLY